jgi:hypothetical protein
MLASIQGSFTVVGPNTDTPAFYWRGQQLNHVISMRSHFDSDEHNVKIKVFDVAGLQDTIYAEMTAAGINVKKVSV